MRHSEIKVYIWPSTFFPGGSSGSVSHDWAFFFPSSGVPRITGFHLFDNYLTQRGMFPANCQSPVLGWESGLSFFRQRSRQARCARVPAVDQGLTCGKSVSVLHQKHSLACAEQLQAFLLHTCEMTFLNNPSRPSKLFGLLSTVPLERYVYMARHHSNRGVAIWRSVPGDIVAIGGPVHPPPSTRVLPIPLPARPKQLRH
jgi:hypothetical protein